MSLYRSTRGAQRLDPASSVAPGSDGKGPPLLTLGDVAVGGGNDAFIENFYSSPFIDYAEVRARYEKVDVLRRVLFPDKSYFIIADELRGEEDHLYEWGLHGNGGGTSGGQYRRSGNLARWTRGGAELLVYQAVREDRTFTELDAPHSFNFLQELTHTALRVQQSGTDVEFLTILYPRSLEEGQEPIFATLETGGGEAVQVGVGHRRDLTWVRRAGAATTVFDSPGGTVQSDARFGFLRFERSQLQALALREAGFLRVAGRGVIGANAAIDVSLKMSDDTAAGYVRGSDAGYRISLALGRSVEDASYRKVTVALDTTDGAPALGLEGEGVLDLTLGAVEPSNTAVADEADQPARFSLHANWPNPFNAETQILYQLPTPDTFVRLDVFNLTGQRIRSIVAEHQPAGTFRTSWDGTDDRGRDVGSGIYMMRLKAGVNREMRKMLLLR